MDLMPNITKNPRQYNFTERNNTIKINKTFAERVQTIKIPAADSETKAVPVIQIPIFQNSGTSEKTSEILKNISGSEAKPPKRNNIDNHERRNEEGFNRTTDGNFIFIPEKIKKPGRTAAEISHINDIA